MTEKLLQFIWQFQYFNKADLQTTTGEAVRIVAPGTLNQHQGPDFLDARIDIGGTLLAGSVELHTQSSLWLVHGHEADANYRNVVLHVVVKDDWKQPGGIPVVELSGRISGLLLQKYNALMNAGRDLPCAGSVHEVKALTWMAWKERLVAERLTRKAALVLRFLSQTTHNWEEAFWWALARSFGSKINSDAFEAVARSLPVALPAKHKASIHQLEALLLGQAGLLTKEPKEDYPKLLQREYLFLQKKHDLKPIALPVHFLRMRPHNFPTVRLAQLAMLLHTRHHLFSAILEAKEVAAVQELFRVTANDYWHYHYLLDEPSAFKKKTLGKVMVDNIIINTVIPALFAYGLYHGEEKFKEKALAWLQQSAAEENSITKVFTTLNLPNKNAFDSQAFIELKNEYCTPLHCLACSVGNAILKGSEASK
jgi:hypothetical protein